MGFKFMRDKNGSIPKQVGFSQGKVIEPLQ